jgi:signal peptide peptidase SppA
MPNLTTNSYVLRAFVETPWAIRPHKLAMLEEIIARHVSGEKLSAEEIQARINGASRPADRRVESVAVLPLFGTIFPRANLMTEMSGATSAEKFGAQFAGLINDPEIDAIVLDVDSPGGQVGGIDELSRQIYDSRGKKPIVAVANQDMASAAYYIGTAADEVVVSPSGEVGSIGVFAVHQDWSVAAHQDGVKISIIKEGKYKAEANPYQPLTDEARAAIQENVREYYDSFVGAVARNRGVSDEAVRNGFGQGRMVTAKRAVEMGMADRVGTLNQTIQQLLSRGGTPFVDHPIGAVSSKQTEADVERARQIERLRGRIKTYRKEKTT